MRLSLVTTFALLFAVGSLANAQGDPVKRQATTTTSSARQTQSGIVCNCNNYYTVVSGDTCSGIVSKYNNAFTLNQFYSWNPAVGSSCGNLWVGYQVCVGVSTASCTTTTVASTTTSSTSTTVSNSAPSPTQSGLASNCNAFYNVVSGDSCQGIVNKFNNFTLNQFYSWNPAVGSSCGSLWVGYYVCVGVPGTSTTTTTPSTASTVTSSASCVTATNSGPSPEQTGIAWNCNAYYYVVSGDSCSSIQTKFNNFTLNQFYSWNPAVGSSCGSLWTSYYVCIGVNTAQTVSCVKSTTSTSATSTSSSIIVSTTGTWWYISSVQIDPQISPTVYPTYAAPSPVQSGIQPGCVTYYKAVTGDNCSSITTSFFGFNTAQFISWNPGVGSTCGNVIAGNYYCVQPSLYRAGPLVYSYGLPNSSLPNCIIQDCSAWYQATGNDTCYTIPSLFNYNFTFNNFLNWNPSISWTNCTGFTTGQFYCVNWPGQALTPAYSNVSYFSNSSTGNDTTFPNATMVFYNFPNTTCTTATSVANATSTNGTITSTVSTTTTSLSSITSTTLTSTTSKPSTTTTTGTTSSNSSTSTSKPTTTTTTPTTTSSSSKPTTTTTTTATTK